MVNAHGETAEAQALREVIRSLAAKDGAFAESDLWAFSTETIVLVDASVEARVRGFDSEEESRSTQDRAVQALQKPAV